MLTLLRRVRSARESDQAGFTLIELTITLMIGAVVSAALLGLLTSQTSAQRRLTNLVGNQEAARLALVEMQQDLRSAEPLVTLSDATQYPSLVRIVTLDFTTGAETQFQWRIDSATHQLVRETLATNGTVTATTYRLKGVSETSIFRYFDANANEYATDGSTQSSIIARCTLRMRITLHAAVDSGPAPTLASSDVEMRNRLPGDYRCG